MSAYVKLDAWARTVLADPYGKGVLIDTPQGLHSAYGMVYPMVDGIFDLRHRAAATIADTAIWQAGQEYYEAWSRRLIEEDAHQDYMAEIEGVREVYQAIPVTGRVLDIGGQQGRLREFLAPDQEYLSCDPFINVFTDIDRQINLLKAYKCLQQPCNFIAAHAEHLPIVEATFDTVHMRSVIDHFRDPELALIEAFRILRPKGRLIVGLMVEGGRSGRPTLQERAKEVVRAALPWIGVTRYTDYHIWHPTYAQLEALIRNSNFKILQTHWQKGWNDRVCYIEAEKISN